MNAGAAQRRLDQLNEAREWQEVARAPSIVRIRRLIEKYPTGAHAEAARVLAASLESQEMVRVGEDPNAQSSSRSDELQQVALQTKRIPDTLFLREQKRVEARNLFFPRATFTQFTGGRIRDRLEFRKAQPIRRLLLTNDLAQLYSGGDDGAVRIWDLNGVRKSEMLAPLHGKRIYALARSENSRYMATGSWDRKVFLWDSHSNKIFGTVTVRPQIYSMTFSPTGRWIAAAGTDGQVDFIRVTKQRVVNRRHITPARRIHAIAYLPNRSEDLIVGDASGALRLWSVRPGREKHISGAHNAEILALAVSSNGSSVASAGLDRSIKLWSDTLQNTATIDNAHRRYITALQFTPDGRYLASGGADFLVRMWDVRTLKVVGSPFAGHSGDVEDIEFSPDGKYMFTSSEDKTVKIWDVDGAKLIHTLVAFTDGGYVIFDPDQRYLASEGVRSILTRER